MILNTTYNENCLATMSRMPDDFVDLTVTSPPYDGLRVYNGYSFDFESIARELYRILKPGGVVVWVVGDQTKKGTESGTSFRQALFFKEIGFNIHDTMIWDKVNTFGSTGNPALRYAQNFEYIFVFSKGRPKTVNLIKVPCIYPNKEYSGTTRRNRKDGGINEILRNVDGTKSGTHKIAANIFKYPVGYNKSSKDVIAFEHPAIFPEQLAVDNIITWSNSADIVYDPFMGSGTTAKSALMTGRKFIGSEISDEYCKIIGERIKPILYPDFSKTLEF